LIGDPAAIRTYLERTKNEVGQAIDRLSNEEEQLTSRLRGISEDLQRLRAIQQVLERGMEAEAATLAPEPINTTGPDQADALPGNPPEGAVDADAGLSDTPFPTQEAVQPAGLPGEEGIHPTGLISPVDPGPPPTPTLDGTAPSQEQRLRDVESKLDRLLEAIESLKGELQTIKGEGESPRSFSS
jgi:TolA-binding protein